MYSNIYSIDYRSIVNRKLKEKGFIMSKVKEKQARQRTKIIESVIPLIASEDFDRISVAELCQTAGISIGTFYHYFTKKTDLLIGMLWIIDEDLEENVFPLLTKKDDMENLRIFAHGWACHIQKNGLERAKLISTINPESEVLIESERVSVQKIRQIFTSAQKKGRIGTRFTPEELTDYFLLMLRSVSTDWSRREGNYDIVQKIDACTEFFILGCRK